MTLKNIFIFLVVGFFFLSCGNDPLNVDVSAVKIKYSFENLDSVLYHATDLELKELNKSGEKEFGEIFNYVTGYCLKIGNVSDTAFANSINAYKEDQYIKKLENSIKKNFRNAKELNLEIEDGLKHLKFHFPKGKMPEKVVLINSLFNSSIFCTENEIGIGIERYLGGDNPVVQELNPMHYHEWIKNGMKREFASRDAITGWVETHYVAETSINLADEIIRWGKIIYLTEAAFPDSPKHWIMRYTEKELNWATENESAFWEYLVKEKLLFDKNERNSMNMLNPGPTTSGLPNEGSPDRLGQYLGWKMVKSYMEKNDVSLAEMVKLPYNVILQEYEID